MFGELRFLVDLGGQYTQGLGGENTRIVGINTRGVVFLVCVAAVLGGGSWYHFR